jgi:hypothetical protein
VKRLAFALLACAACHTANPDTRAVVPAQPDTRPVPIAEPKEEQHATIEYVVVPAAWVEKVAPAPAADVKAWAADNKNAIATPVRHILFKVEDKANEGAQKKRAEQAIARLAKGEDFAKLAKELSDDPGSKDKGGMYAAEMIENFVEPFKAAYASLAPGETTKQPVRTQFGWHVIKKEPASDDDLAAAFKHAKADGLAKKLADELLARMRTADSTRAAIAGAVESVLGEDAKENAERPQAQLVVDKNIDRLHVSPEARAALGDLAKTGRTGQVASSPIASKNAWLAARVASAPPR